MIDELKLLKTLAKRLEKIAAIAHVDPESIVETALKDRLDYLEWKENAIAEGQADLDAGRVVSTQHLRKALAKQPPPTLERVMQQAKASEEWRRKNDHLIMKNRIK